MVRSLRPAQLVLTLALLGAGTPACGSQDPAEEDAGVDVPGARPEDAAADAPDDAQAGDSAPDDAATADADAEAVGPRGPIHRAGRGPVAHGEILRLEHDDSLSFPRRERGAQALFDVVEYAYERGARNDFQASLDDMQRVPRHAEDPGSLWALTSTAATPGGGMRITRTRPARHPFERAHYFGRGPHASVGWPVVLGGTTPDGTSRTLYASWWCKMPFDLARYHAIPADAAPTAFETGEDEAYGEEVTVDGLEGTGRILTHLLLGDGGVPTGWLFFEPPVSARSINDLRGRVVRGVRSGASVVFPTTFAPSKFDAPGYLSPRGKYARFRTEYTTGGFRTAIGNVGVSGSGGPQYYPDAVRRPDDWDRRLVQPGAWNHWEVELVLTPDQPERIRRRVVVNGQTIIDTNEDMVRAVVAQPDWGPPTLALLGVDDFMAVPFVVEVSDVVVDDELARVVLGDAPRWSDVTRTEIQRSVSWTEDVIEVAVHWGALPGDAWLYVLDDEGAPILEDGVAIELAP